MRTTTTISAGFVAAALLLATTTGCTSPAATGTPADALSSTPLVPASGVSLGVYYGDRSPEDTHAELGTTPAVHLTYVGWEDPWTTDPVLAEDAARGQTSMINWEPFGVDLQDVVDGEHDDLLARRGLEAGRMARPVLLDLAAEMNEEEGWGDHDPELYVSAYRHVHDVVTAEAGGNVVWVWAPNNVDSDGGPAALEYYPGDEYVDWTGMDGYNWGTSDPDHAWQSFEEVFRDLYDDLHELGKPIIIGETASAETGGSKSAWISGVVPTLRDEFPDVRAVVWFDVDKERDWRIASSASSLAAFGDLATDPSTAGTS